MPYGPARAFGLEEDPSLYADPAIYEGSLDPGPGGSAGMGAGEPGADMTDEALAAEYGLGAPPSAADYSVPDAPDPGMYDLLLETLGRGLQSIQRPRVRNFGEGLAVGFGTGLGAYGAQRASARQQFEARQEKRRLSLDEERRQATKAYQGEISKARAAKQREGAKMVAVDDALIARYPALAIKKGDLISEGQFTRMTGGVKGPAELKAIETEAEARARGTRRGAPLASSNANPGQSDMVAQIADGVESGLIPPDLKGYYRLTGPVNAELAKRGFNRTEAVRKWQGDQVAVRTLNGPQQTRLRQAIDTADAGLGIVDDLSGQLSQRLRTARTPVKIFNRGAMIAAKNGAFGPDAQAIAVQLEAQIADITSELANAYMGGNAATDHALALASKNLSSEWNEQTLAAATKLARQNLAIRRSAIFSSAVPQYGPAAGSGSLVPGAGGLEPGAMAAPAGPSAADLEFLNAIGKGPRSKPYRPKKGGK